MKYNDTATTIQVKQFLLSQILKECLVKAKRKFSSNMQNINVNLIYKLISFENPNTRKQIEKYFNKKS